MRKLIMFLYLADTFVVKDTQSFIKVRGVVPVMSSHWAGDVPPVTRCFIKWILKD